MKSEDVVFMNKIFITIGLMLSIFTIVLEFSDGYPGDNGVIFAIISVGFLISGTIGANLHKK